MRTRWSDPAPLVAGRLTQGFGARRLVLSVPATLVLAVLRKGLVLAAVDVAVSVRRCDTRHPLLRAQRLLEALVFRLLFYSPMSSSVLLVVFSSLVIQSCLLAGCFTQGCGARPSVALILLACPCSAFVRRSPQHLVSSVIAVVKL